MTAFHVILSFGLLFCLAAIVFPYKPFKGRGQAFGWFVVLAFVSVVARGTETNRSEPTESSSKAQVAESTGSGKSADSAREPSTSNWALSESTDEMTSVVSKFACAKSTNQLTFAFPYNGGSTGELCFRQKGKKLDAYVSISSGQFLCSFDGCYLRLKFDDGPVTAFEGSETDDHRSNMLFIESAPKLLHSISKAKQLKLQAKFYQEGNQVMTFDVDGLDWPK